MGCFVEFRASAPCGATGVIGVLHFSGARLPRKWPAAVAAAVLTFSIVLIGFTLPRINSLTMRGSLDSAPNPCTRRTSALGSTRPRLATMFRENQRMMRHFRNELCCLRLERFNDPADNRNTRRADLFALITRDAVEYSCEGEGTLDLVGIVTRVERGLPQLDERGRASEVG